MNKSIVSEGVKTGGASRILNGREKSDWKGVKMGLRRTQMGPRLVSM
jgi:hypothetical protein